MKTAMNKVEIEITARCNLGCPNCDRSCGMIQSDDMMTVDQIRNFVDETLELNHRWIWIRILGGEPTLHPDLMKIIDQISRIKKAMPGTIVQVISNRYGEQVNRILTSIPEWVEIRGAPKRPEKPPLFSTYNLAPIDDPRYAGADFSRGCWVSRRCGMGLSRFGFYPCGAGAAVDRVFGLDIGIKTLAAVSTGILQKQRMKLCQWCGHFKDDIPGKRAIDQTEWSRKQQTSISWLLAYERYEKRTKMTEYPERKSNERMVCVSESES